MTERRQVYISRQLRGFTGQNTCGRCGSWLLYDYEGPFCLLCGHQYAPAAGLEEPDGKGRHRGRASRRVPRSCEVCGATYTSSHSGQRACSRVCGAVLSHRPREVSVARG